MSTLNFEERAWEYDNDDEYTPEPRHALALLHCERFAQTKRIEDIDRAISIARECIRQPFDHNQSLARVWTDLRMFLVCRFEEFSETGDLEQAIEAAKGAVNSASYGVPLQAIYLNNLAALLRRKYEDTEELNDLTNAIEVIGRATEMIPYQHPDRPVLLSNLGTFLGWRYERTKDVNDLDRAIEVATEAAGSVPYDRFRRVVCLNSLMNRLVSRHKRNNDISDLNKAIETTRTIIDLTSSDDISRVHFLHNLGIQLGRRCEVEGDERDLEDAIKVTTEAIKLTPIEDADRVHILGTLTNTLNIRYGWRGDINDLELAIDTASQVVRSISKDHPAWAGTAYSLSNAYRHRYERKKEWHDLRQAFEIAAQVVDAIPDEYPDRAACLQLYSNLLGSVYDRTWAMSTLEKAIKIARDVVALTVGNASHLAVSLTNLGNNLDNMYERTGDTSYLEQAIEAAKEAVNSTSYNHPNRAGRLHNLGIKLAKRYKETKDMIYLEEAIEAADRALGCIPYFHPDRAALLISLGSMLQIGHARMTEESDLSPASAKFDDLSSASAKFEEAARSSNALPLNRVTAAAHCLKLFALQKRVGDGIRIGEIALDLLPKVYTRILDRVDQQFVLSAFAGVASNLCAFYLSEGRSCDALHCLERGRAVITAQLLNDRDDMSSLFQNYPTLAERYHNLVYEINSSFQRRDESMHNHLWSMDHHQSAKRQREAATELDVCLGDIRAIPEYGRFLLGQTTTEMQNCAGDGYIVAVNITDFRSDAIVVSNRSVEAIPLPTLSAVETRDWLRKSWVAKRKEGQRLMNDEFSEYLSWLWNNCVKHIIESVHTSIPWSSQGLPRVWWIGCGLATSLPFHAAGLHLEGSDEIAYNKIVSSYTASIKALSYARLQATRAKQKRTPDNGMVIATMPTSPKRRPDLPEPDPLPGSLVETDEILKVAQACIRTTVLSYPSAEQVLQALEQSSFAHFACHGISNKTDPSRSGLILQKTTPERVPEQDFLSVFRISQLRLKYAQIAYLSACSTAENKPTELSDEVIHVVSGFQVAGFPHVVGCLWQAGDSECAAVAREFYSSIFRNTQSALQNGDVALALQEAVMRLRATELSMPRLWAQFVHFGV